MRAYWSSIFPCLCSFSVIITGPNICIHSEERSQKTKKKELSRWRKWFNNKYKHSHLHSSSVSAKKESWLSFTFCLHVLTVLSQSGHTRKRKRKREGKSKVLIKTILGTMHNLNWRKLTSWRASLVASPWLCLSLSHQNREGRRDASLRSPPLSFVLVQPIVR